MNGPRDASLSRFRATLQARVKNVRSLFEVLEYLPADPDAVRQVQGELHTLKGEARLLGLLAMSELTHAIEGRVDPGGATDFLTIGKATEVLADALDGDSDSRAIDARVRLAMKELFGLETELPEEASPVSMEGELGPETPAPNPGLAKRERQRWVQVDADLLDALCESMGELSASFGRFQAELRPTLGANEARIRAALAGQLDACRELLDGAVDQSWGLRLAPIEPMLRQLEQHARVLATRTHKEVEIIVSASGVQLERDVVDQVWDSLIHLVQNAIAHGIESADERAPKPRCGLLRFSASSVGANVTLTVEDDGAGIDPRKVKEAALSRGVVTARAAEGMSDEDLVLLLFRPGFSTEKKVDDLSGRGIGLDVVKAKIEALGGHVKLTSRIGQGTRAVLTVPHAITKERVLVLEVAGMRYGIPSRLIRAVLGKHEFAASAGPEPTTVRYREQLVPLRSLARALGAGDAANENAALVVQLGDKVLAAKVERVVGELDLLRRPADPLLSATTGIGASGHGEDGALILLLEYAYLERILARAQGTASAPQAKAEQRRTRVLVVDDSPVVTDLVSELLTSAGLSVEVVHNGEQALVAIDREHPELVLSDVEMPRMNGFDLLKAIRTRSQSLPVVMLTTRGSVEDRQRASSLGANAYVLKTAFRSDVLLDTVGRFLRLRP